MATTQNDVEREDLTQLVREAMSNARELVSVEVELAKLELEKKADGLKGAALSFVLALGFLTAAITMLGVALALALGGSALVAVGVAVAFGVAGTVALLRGKKALPAKPLDEAQERVESDVRQLQERTT